MPGDTNFTSDVFRLDRATGEIQRVSVSSAGEQASNASGGATITPDGRLVAFGSDASNLVPGEVDDFAGDVYLRDVQAGTTVGISTVATGFVRHSAGPVLSADGNLVAFSSWDYGLVTGDDNNSYDVFVFDRTAGTFERVSVDSAGTQGHDWSLSADMTPDGRYVTFNSFASNLVAGDTNF